VTTDLLHRLTHDPGWHLIAAALVFELGLALTVISLTTRSTR
jgi:hypothetical protein